MNKVVLLHVIPEAEEANAIPRRSHPQTVRLHQWHVTRGGYIIKKELQRWVSLDVNKRMVASTTFNASYQTSWPHLCGEDP